MLTVKKIELSKSREKGYKISDSGGLYLYVSVTSNKSFRMDYKFNKKWKTLTIGKYPLVTLQEARELREKAKKLISMGLDPAYEKKMDSINSEIINENIFSNIAIEWHDSKKKSWTKKTSDMIINYLEKDIFPIIGKFPINTIKPQEMLNCLKKIEQRGALEVARKIRMRCSEIFQYAIVTGRADNNPARELSKAMVNYTPKNYPFLTEIEMISFLKELDGYSGNIIIRMATKLLIITALRTGELRTLKWSDIDFNEKIINVREEVIKKNRKHMVPLSEQAIEILKFLKPITGNHEYIFPGRNDYKKTISEGSILGVIKRIGFANRATGHGFRHQFSTVLNENGFNHDWIEKQLNHESQSVRMIYNHAQYLDGRRSMMQWYADYIDKLSIS